MRVLLADDHALVRAGIGSLLRASGADVVGEAGDGDEAISLARTLRPDLIFMDVQMPNRSGLEATRVIKAEMPDVKVVMLTVSDDEADLFEAVKSGAEGYLLKNLREDEFAEVLLRLGADEPILSPPLARKLFQEFARLKHSSDDELTKREKEVLALVTSGATNKEIASQLYISASTVDFHVHNILTKLHLRNRTQAVAWAMEHGFVSS